MNLIQGLKGRLLRTHRLIRKGIKLSVETRQIWRLQHSLIGRSSHPGCIIESSGEIFKAFKEY